MDAASATRCMYASTDGTTLWPPAVNGTLPHGFGTLSATVRLYSFAMARHAEM
ncbi:hypothetical protein ABZ942_30925 [Nocardia sp. NPDC046473]|uniref:hypothetical protein n=1 Tax=Nocardia sp. NPDC046473 TaxID=3155733 RepID=UPI0033C0C91E